MPNGSHRFGEFLESARYRSRVTAGAAAVIISSLRPAGGVSLAHGCKVPPCGLLLEKDGRRKLAGTGQTKEFVANARQTRDESRRECIGRKFAEKPVAAGRSRAFHRGRGPPYRHILPLRPAESLRGVCQESHFTERPCEQAVRLRQRTLGNTIHRLIDLVAKFGGIAKTNGCQARQTLSRNSLKPRRGRLQACGAQVSRISGQGMEPGQRGTLPGRRIFR